MLERAKEKRLRKLQLECRNFFKDIYSDNRSKVLVFGQGNPDAHLVLVGEAPGEQETIKQRPFAGQAGRNLDEFLEIVGLNREDIYITNVVKFRPFKMNPQTGRLSNRPPNREEIELSCGWLYKELEILRPQVVVSLGNIALKALCGQKNITIGQVHGIPMDCVLGESHLEIKLFPLYHPASIIYNRGLKETYMRDLEKLRDYLKFG